MKSRIAFVAAAVAALLLAAPAWSAEVKKVRVGQHPEFTRIVFELDSPAGYRIARANNPDGSTDIVVTLDASADARTLASGSSLVKGVTVDRGAGRSMARIHLRKSGLPLKEMILREPARIVLDVMGTDEALLKLQAARKARAAAKKQQAQAKAAPAKPPAPVKQAKAAPVPKPKPAAKTQPKPQRTAAAQKPATPKPAAKPKPATPKAVAKKPPTPEQVAKAEPKPPAPAPKAKLEPKKPAPKQTAELPKRDASAEEAARAAMRERLARVEEAKQQRMREAEAARKAREMQVAEKSDEPEAPAARPEPPTPERRAEADDAEEDGGSLLGFDPVMAGAIAGGVLLLLVVVMMVRRRRSLPKNLDVTALADDAAPGDDQRIPEGGFSMDLDDSDESPADGDDVVVGVTDREPPLSAPGLFDEAEKGDTAMDQQGIDLGDTMSSATTQTGIGGAPDVSSMMAEFERRIAQLESRLDQEVEARERLERQVAAQSEELRVQRAAIARTQRALRGMTRSEEEQATEPALRDPSS